MEKQFTETLGTRVQIQKTDFGGKLTIDYFSTDDLEVLLSRIKQEYQNSQMTQSPVDTAAAITQATALEITDLPVPQSFADVEIPEALFIPEVADEIAEETLIEPEEDDSSLYSINNFTV
jgi:hypothetical protein